MSSNGHNHDILQNLPKYHRKSLESLLPGGLNSTCCHNRCGMTSLSEWRLTCPPRFRMVGFATQGWLREAKKRRSPIRQSEMLFVSHVVPRPADNRLNGQMVLIWSKDL